MIKTIRVQKLYVNDKTKDGKPFYTKKGKPYKIANITCGDGTAGSMFIFDDRDLDKVTVGKEVQVDVEVNGQYTNFRLPSKENLLEQRISNLEQRMDKLYKFLAGKLEKVADTPKTTEKVTDEELDKIAEDIN